MKRRVEDKKRVCGYRRDIERDFGAQLVREWGNNILGDGPIRRDGDDSGGERNEDATRQEAI